MKLKPVWGLKSPAAIAHDGKCNEVLIDPLIWWMFSPQERRFIIEHERAHCEHNVYDEVSADRIGFDEFIENGGNPYAAITALKQLGNSPSVNQRVETIIQENMFHLRQPYQSQAPQNWNYSFFGPDEAWGHGNDTGGRNKWDADDWNNLIGEVGGIVAAILGGRNHSNQGGYYPPQQPRNDTWLYVIGGLIILLLVLVITQKK